MTDCTSLLAQFNASTDQAERVALAQQLASECGIFVDPDNPDEQSGGHGSGDPPGGGN